ncbi:MAG TPA: branched-chain amino acid ABC transporter permease [Candidatus Cybelea sp.]|nr:branched-chain amino acid ABC transporter permease [Candidatus Cybelea sp.]
MSAAEWRRAMNTGAGRRAWSRIPGGPEAGGAPPSSATVAMVAAPGIEARIGALLGHIRLRHVLVLAAVLVYPWVVNSFFAFQIGGQAMALGLIALSLTFLGGYGGMVSLAQMTVAGVASYMVAIFGVAGAAQGGASSLGWPWEIAVVIAVLVATIFATLVGWLSVRTEGIYTIMITLAIGVSFYYLAQQNYSIFGGHEGFNQVYAPTVLGINFRDPIPFYYLALFWALAGYFFVKYLLRSPFGIALQGVRENPRRMNALGFHVTAHRVFAYSVGGVLAAIGGVLMVWYNNRVSPGSASTEMMLNILIIAVMGGMKHPIGAFIGAIVFVLVQNFAIDIIARERFNLVIGGVFLLIVLFSPDGLLGLWAYFRDRFLSGGIQSKFKSAEGG